MKIRIITNYFGRTPPIMQLWLDSCSFNKDIGWIFYADFDTRTLDVPENVLFVQTSFDAFRTRVKKCIPYPIEYGTSWEFCALKPLIGTCFRDDIGDADFWGWCDCDLLFGDLSPCVTATDCADKIMPRGHLSLIRKDTRLDAFVLNHPLCRTNQPCFDEIAFPEKVLPEFGARQKNDIPYINAACRPGNFILADVKALTDRLGLPSDGSVPFVATWKEGKMFGHFAMPDGCVREVEVAYFHFFRRDMAIGTKRLLNGRTYLIAPNVIREYDGHDLSHHEILKLDAFRIHWPYWRKRLTVRHVMNKLREKLG